MDTSLEIFDGEQGTEAWYAARLGIPTASEFATVLATGKKAGSVSKERQTYMRKLAGERITGQPMWTYSNDHMERGKEQEAEARDLYALVTDAQPYQVAFLRRGDAGASPDALIGEDGMLEIKTKLAHLQIAVLEEDKVPAEHVAQLQGQLWIAARPWVDFVSYCPGLPPFIRRVERDETYIATLAVAVEEFNAELAALVARIQSYRSKA